MLDWPFNSESSVHCQRCHFGLLEVELSSRLACVVLEVDNTVDLLIGRHVGTSVFARWMRFRST